MGDIRLLPNADVMRSSAGEFNVDGTLQRNRQSSRLFKVLGVPGFECHTSFL